MITRFLNQKAKARAPEGQRIYAIGDIHGRVDLLDELLSKIFNEANLNNVFSGGDLAPEAINLVFLGDYVDRGPDSKAVVERLINLQKEHPQTLFLKGNHEAAMQDFMADPKKNDAWLGWGGIETLESYGVNSLAVAPVGDLAGALAANLPEDHLAFLQDLKLMHTIGDYLFVHAGVKPGVALNEQAEADLLWIRHEFHKCAAKLRPAQTVIHGHQPVDKPEDKGWRVNVDTGACWSGILTAVVLEHDRRRFISTGD